MGNTSMHSERQPLMQGKLNRKARLKYKNNSFFFTQICH